jgi:uncharacterized membrane-anchored protein
MKTPIKWFWLIVTAQAAFLLGWAGYHEFLRQNAPVILLKGRPVDPRDLLRGDYMTMGYEINTPSISDAGVKSGTSHPSGGDAWVLLEKRDGYHVVAKASVERLTPSPAQVLVRGTFGHNGRAAGQSIRIDYGIERYFVPEGKGSPQFKQVEVEVSVSPTHRLYIRRVLLDGKVYP